MGGASAVAGAVVRGATYAVVGGTAAAIGAVGNAVKVRVRASLYYA